ncbi:membrane protein [Brucella intermedia 229E]|uniref:Membrane protein n=1 Tax=Brucella intermedia 229E TaxID=1337887 RepID=U4VEP8_9HYPH|nr:membrane protein [Brucella intermedia 229E]
MNIATKVPTEGEAKQAATPNAAAGPQRTEAMKGRVDAIEEGRLYGWAFDPSVPTERLLIRVLLDDKPIAEAPADKDRPPDLKRNGIGDGKHAFEVMLPQFAAARAGELVVVAANAAGGEQKLRVPKPDEQAAEALIAAPMTRILDKLDMLMAAQRQLQVNQRSLQRVAPTLDASGNAAPAELLDIASSVDGLRTDLHQRMTELDVHIMRMDGVVAGLEQRMEDVRKRSSGDIKLLFMLMFVLAGFVAGAF